MQPLAIGVCSWSLQIPDLDQCLSTIRNELGVDVVQLGWWDDGYKEMDKVLSLVEKHGMTVSATCAGFAGEDYGTIARIAETGGFKPDATWDERYAKMVELSDLTVLLKTKLLAGSWPERRRRGYSLIIWASSTRRLPTLACFR